MQLWNMQGTCCLHLQHSDGRLCLWFDLWLGSRKGEKVTVETKWCSCSKNRRDCKDLGSGGSILEKDRHIGFKYA